MITITYTITPAITAHLIAIDAYRRTILTTPVSPRNEQKLRWSAMIGHIAGSLTLAQTTLLKSHIIAMLTYPSKRPTSAETLVTSCKNCIDWIRDEWSANPKLITLSTVETIATMILGNKTADVMFRHDQQTVKQILTYIQTQSDHPVLVAGIAHGMIAGSSTENVPQGLVSRLLGTLILTKYGYDCRGMFAVDHAWIEGKERFLRALTSIQTQQNLTAWLEYYTAITESVYESLAASITRLGSDVLTGDSPYATWRLHPREEHILHRLDAPTSKITNRDVQRAFHISQVTASRSLTHLLSLGLLYAHGKGRSVYYTKA